MPGPDPGSACAGDGEEGRDDVYDEAPFLVGLEAVDCYESDVRD